MQRHERSLKGSNPYVERSSPSATETCWSSYLGFRLRLHPRLYKCVAVGDKIKPKGWTVPAGRRTVPARRYFFGFR